MKKGDFIVIAVILLLSIFCALPFLAHKDGNVAIATISQNGKVIYTIDLNDADNQGKTFTISGKFTNKILVEDGKIAVVSSDCPDKSCIKCGAINSSQRVISCLPNQLIITVEQSAKNDVDVISG